MVWTVGLMQYGLVRQLEVPRENMAMKRYEVPSSLLFFPILNNITSTEWVSLLH
jgi:hypothetical protein